MRAAVAALFALAANVLFAAPEVLIVQRLSTAEGAFNVPVGQRLADELDVEGRVSPILWSMTDPIFRAYIDDGKLPRFVENPDDRTIRDYAGRLRVAYVLIVEASALQTQVVPQAYLYSGTRSRPMWSMERQENRGKPRLVVVQDGKVDEDKTQQIREKYADVIGEGVVSTMTVLVNGQPDWDSTAASLARTWTRILAEGPFSHLEPMRRTFPPEPDPGLTFAAGSGLPTPPDTSLAVQRAEVLAADGQEDEAIVVLRDAIDSNPFAKDARLLFARLLLQRGHPAVAAVECERGAALAEDSGELWALAADSWIQAGDPDRALNAAHEAQARGIATPELLQTLGDVWLLKNDLQNSLKFYDEAIEQQASKRALVGRAMARAMAADSEGAIRDIEAAQEDGPMSIDLYQRAMAILRTDVDSVVSLLKRIPMGVRIQDGEDMRPSAEQLQKKTAAMVELMVRIRVPERHVESHRLRDLACKLLSQSSVEVLAYARTKNEDASLEAAISLGEAIELLPRVDELFQFERKYGQRPTTD